MGSAQHTDRTGQYGIAAATLTFISSFRGGGLRKHLQARNGAEGQPSLEGPYGARPTLRPDRLTEAGIRVCMRVPCVGVCFATPVFFYSMICVWGNASLIFNFIAVQRAKNTPRDAFRIGIYRRVTLFSNRPPDLGAPCCDHILFVVSVFVRPKGTGGIGMQH